MEPAAEAGCGRNFAEVGLERTVVAGVGLGRTAAAGTWLERTVVAEAEFERTVAAMLLDLATILDCEMLEGLCLKKEYLGK